MSYLAIVERVDQSWNGYVPDLPGCVAAADAAACVEELMREAVPRHVAMLRSRGETIPSHRSRRSRSPSVTLARRRSSKQL